MSRCLGALNTHNRQDEHGSNRHYMYRCTHAQLLEFLRAFYRLTPSERSALKEEWTRKWLAQEGNGFKTGAVYRPRKRRSMSASAAADQKQREGGEDDNHGRRHLSRSNYNEYWNYMMFVARQVSAYALLERCSVEQAAMDVEHAQRRLSARGDTMRVDEWKKILSRSAEMAGSAMQKAMLASIPRGGLAKSVRDDLQAFAAGRNVTREDLLRVHVVAASASASASSSGNKNDVA